MFACSLACICVGLHHPAVSSIIIISAYKHINQLSLVLSKETVFFTRRTSTRWLHMLYVNERLALQFGPSICISTIAAVLC